jgi:CheY-like chemotaxis protein
LDNSLQYSQKLLVLFLANSEKDIEIVYQKLTDAIGGSIRGIRDSIHLDTAQNEMTFLNLISHNKYDVILSDYTLLDYNVLTALEQARTIRSDTPFICISSPIGEDLAVEIIKRGAFDFVLKDTPLTGEMHRLPSASKKK